MALFEVIDYSTSFNGNNNADLQLKKTKSVKNSNCLNTEFYQKYVEIVHRRYNVCFWIAFIILNCTSWLIVLINSSFGKFDNHSLILGRLGIVTERNTPGIIKILSSTVPGEFCCRGTPIFLSKI